MKKTFLIVFLCTIALPAFSQTTFSARYGRRGQRPPQPVVQPTGEGALQKGVRNGNPLQLLNPLAPSEYGSGADVVVYERGTDPDPVQKWRDPKERPTAVRLLSFLFW